MMKSGIKVTGHTGTWYVIDTKEVNDHELWLLEHETHGEDANHLITYYGGEKIIVEDVTNGWDDLPNKYEIEVAIKGALPHSSFPGSYPLIYLSFANEVSCATCAAENAEGIVHHDVYMEGPPIHCEGCNAEIESAYGDPYEDEE